MTLSIQMVEQIILMCNLAFGVPDPEIQPTLQEKLCKAQLVACYVDTDRPKGSFSSHCVSPIIKKISEEVVESKDK